MGISRHKRIDYDEVRKVISESSPETEIFVGCDSIRFRRHGQTMASYAKVIIVHIDSKHGCRVFGEIDVIPDYNNMRQRLMQEVQFAVDVALHLTDVIGERSFQIHLDINKQPEHLSNTVMKEAMGYVRGVTGIEPTLKPDSLASSTCADYFCRRH